MVPRGHPWQGWVSLCVSRRPSEQRGFQCCPPWLSWQASERPTPAAVSCGALFVGNGQPLLVPHWLPPPTPSYFLSSCSCQFLANFKALLVFLAFFHPKARLLSGLLWTLPNLSFCFSSVGTHPNPPPPPPPSCCFSFTGSKWIYGLSP